MSLTFGEMCNAVDDARRTLASADRVAGQMARMLAGRLRSSDIPPHILRQLKRELADFNIRTGEWKQ